MMFFSEISFYDFYTSEAFSCFRELDFSFDLCICHIDFHYFNRFQVHFMNCRIIDIAFMDHIIFIAVLFSNVIGIVDFQFSEDRFAVFIGPCRFDDIGKLFICRKFKTYILQRQLTVRILLIDFNLTSF